MTFSAVNFLGEKFPVKSFWLRGIQRKLFFGSFRLIFIHNKIAKFMPRSQLAAVKKIFNFLTKTILRVQDRSRTGLFITKMIRESSYWKEKNKSCSEVI